MHNVNSDKHFLTIDLHIHTILSGDSHSTLSEYIERAKKLKMKVIGISDHGPGINHVVSHNHFRSLRRIPSNIDGVRVLKGIEANIIDTKGNIDLNDDILKTLDYTLASIHTGTPYKDKGVEINTLAYINAIKSGKVKIISHPFQTEVETNIEPIAIAACENNVLLEVDLFYLKPFILNEKTKAKLKKMIEIVKKYKKKVIVNSDSHNIWELGDDSILTDKLKKEIGLTDDIIINNYPKELEKFLGVKF